MMEGVSTGGSWAWLAPAEKSSPALLQPLVLVTVVVVVVAGMALVCCLCCMWVGI